MIFSTQYIVCIVNRAIDSDGMNLLQPKLERFGSQFRSPADKLKGCNRALTTSFDGLLIVERLAGI